MSDGGCADVGREERFQARFVIGVGKSTYRVVLTDLTKGTAKNARTGGVRRIRRVPNVPEKVEVLSDTDVEMIAGAPQESLDQPMPPGDLWEEHECALWHPQAGRLYYCSDRCGVLDKAC